MSTQRRAAPLGVSASPRSCQMPRVLKIRVSGVQFPRSGRTATGLSAHNRRAAPLIRRSPSLNIRSPCLSGSRPTPPAISRFSTHPREKRKQVQTNYWMTPMTNGWTAERRARQSLAILRWEPWAHSTGPRRRGGKALVARQCIQRGRQ